MKLHFYYIIFLLLLASCKKHNNTPSVQTYKIFDGYIGMNDNSTILTSDNNILVCAQLSPNDGSFHLYKISKDGNTVWDKDFKLHTKGNISGLAESNNHEYYTCGYTYLNSYEITVAKTSSNGELIWSKTYGGTNDEKANEIIKTFDGNILICGTSYNKITDKTDIYLLKLNNDGDSLWSKNYSYASIENPVHLLETTNSEILITTVINQISSYILKVNSNGSKLWDKTISGTIETLASAVELSNGDLIFCGRHDLFIKIIKLNHLGNLIWEKSLMAEIQSMGLIIKQNNNGTLTLLCNAIRLVDGGGAKARTYLKIIDIDGNETVSKLLFDYGAGNINLIKDNNDENIITGFIAVRKTNTNNYFIFSKTDNLGNFQGL